MLLAKIPAPTLGVMVVVAEVHMVSKPVKIGVVGNGLMVTIVEITVVPQVLVTEYEILAVPPDTPVTTPVVFTVATAVLLLDQVPPVVVAVNALVAPSQNVVVPEMLPAVGKVFTNTVFVAAAVLQLLVAV